MNRTKMGFLRVANTIDCSIQLFIYLFFIYDYENEPNNKYRHNSINKIDTERVTVRLTEYMKNNNFFFFYNKTRN